MVDYDFESNVNCHSGWIAIKFCTDIHVPHRMNCKNFGDPIMLTLPVTLSLESLKILITTFLSYNQLVLNIAEKF